MTTNGLTCDQFTGQLMAYLEHEVNDATRAAMERHAATCGECGALLADLRKLRADAANLPTLQPSRDLWSGIAARIEAPVVDIGAGHQLPARRRGLSRWLRGAMIAASLVAAAGIGYVAAGSRVQTLPGQLVQLPPDTVVVAQVPDTVVVPSPGAPSGSGAPRGQLAPPSRQPDVQQVIASFTADYDREIARLRTLIEQRRNQLDPATVAIIEKNIQVIDAAIADSKKAIARDPASRFLIESLNQSLQAKVELMQTAAMLPSRT